MADYMAAATSMSGVDITAVIDQVVVGTLQAISWSITREKAPIYTMGDPNPRSFSRGKRGIAGSMTFITMDRTALWHVMQDKDHWYYAHPLEIVGTDADTSFEEPNPVNYGYLTQTADDTGGTTTYSPQEAIEGTEAALTSDDRLGVYNFQNFNRDIWSLTDMLTNIIQEGGLLASLKTQAVYYDQIPPFNVVLVGQNESGYAFISSLIGVEILNMGGGLSVDDITNEEQTTYISRFWNPWRPVSGFGESASLGTHTEGGGASGIDPDIATNLTTIRES